MLPQGCQGRHARQARDRVVLLQDVGHRRAQEKVKLQGSSFLPDPTVNPVGDGFWEDPGRFDPVDPIDPIIFPNDSTVNLSVDSSRIFRGDEQLIGQ